MAECGELRRGGEDWELAEQLEGGVVCEYSWSNGQHGKARLAPRGQIRAPDPGCIVALVPLGFWFYWRRCPLRGCTAAPTSLPADRQLVQVPRRHIVMPPAQSPSTTCPCLYHSLPYSSSVIGLQITKS